MRSDFNPTTLQSLVARGEQYPTHDFGLVIVDECHHICARSFSNALFTIGAQPQATERARERDGGRGKEGGWVGGWRGGGERRRIEVQPQSTGGMRCPSDEWSSDVCLLGLSATPHRKDGLTDCLHWCVRALRRRRRVE